MDGCNLNFLFFCKVALLGFGFNGIHLNSSVSDLLMLEDSQLSGYLCWES